VFFCQSGEIWQEQQKNPSRKEEKIKISIVKIEK